MTETQPHGHYQPAIPVRFTTGNWIAFSGVAVIVIGSIWGASGNITASLAELRAQVSSLDRRIERIEHRQDNQDTRDDRRDVREGRDK
jgi:hypothetical protein